MRKLLQTAPLAALAVALAFAFAPVRAQLPPEPDKCSEEFFDLCLNGVGGAVTSLDSIRVSATAIGDAWREEEKQRRHGLARAGGTRGMAAGAGGTDGWAVWGSGIYSDYSSDVAIAPYDADTTQVLLGADRRYGENFLAGVVVNYERTDTDTQYNGGGQDRDGVGIGLYGLYLVNDVVSVDGAGGYGRTSTDENRIDPANGARLRGSYDSDRAYLTGNVNAVKAFGDWVLGGRAGILYAVESQDGYVESGGPSARTLRDRHIDLTQGYVGIDVGYAGGAFEPYAAAIYRNDFSSDDGSKAGGLPAGIRTQPDDDDEWQVGLGIRYYGSNGITGTFEWLSTEGRSSFDDDTYTLILRAPL